MLNLQATTTPALDVEKLRKDLRAAAKLLTDEQARYLVDAYYQLQDYRIRAFGQVRNQQTEPTEFTNWLARQIETLEHEIGLVLGRYAKAQPTGVWALSICGIGPVLSAGLLAHCKGYKTVSDLWSFAGMNPMQTWKKGTKRPWNARLKVLCYKIGESFIKVQNNDKDYYGKFYRERKDLELLRNEQGAFKDQANIKVKLVAKTTEAYKAYVDGKLPPAHIHARARRYAVKIFLSHFAAVRWYYEHGEQLPNQVWIIEKGGHRDIIPIPNCPY